MFEVAILKRSFEARDFHSLARLSMVVIVMRYVSEYRTVTTLHNSALELLCLTVLAAASQLLSFGLQSFQGTELLAPPK